MDYREELKKKIVQHVENIDYQMVNRQVKSLLASGYTYEDLYKAMVYWYEIKEKADTNNASGGGVGILKYIMDESSAFWLNMKEVTNNLKGKRIEDSINVIKVKVQPVEDVFRPKLFQLG